MLRSRIRQPFLRRGRQLLLLDSPALLSVLLVSPAYALDSSFCRQLLVINSGKFRFSLEAEVLPEERALGWVALGGR